MEIIASHDLDALRAALAQRISQPSGTPTERLRRAFDAEVTVVPSTHMRRYLERELAKDLGSTGFDDGIVANIDFLQPRQLVYASIGDLPAWRDTKRVLGIGKSPWDANRLTWTIDDVIRSSGLSVPSHSTEPLATSRRIAELFDHYTTHRPEMLRQWNNGHDAIGDDLIGTLNKHQVWQRDLYRAVSHRLADTHRLAVMNVDEWRSHIERAHNAELLPARISVFGVTGIARAVRDVLLVLDQFTEITVYALHAAPSTWPDQAPSEHESREAWSRHLARTRLAAEHHPLHDRWCIQSVENAALLGKPSMVVGGSIDRSTLLGAMRADLTSNSPVDVPLLTEDDLFTALSTGDGSVQVHACYGALRQAEALRDTILRTLRGESALRLRDITIVCADPTTSAPILNAVFNPGRHGGSPSDMPMLPISAVGADSGRHPPIVDSFIAVLSLARSRCSPSEVLEVLALPPVSKRFGLDRDAIERIADWAAIAGVRHGISPRHRLEETGVPAGVSASTWTDALARVATGVAVPAPTDIVGPGGIIPYDTVTSGDLDTFGAISEFLDRLERLNNALQAETGLTIDTWVSTALGVVDEFLSSSNDDAESMVELRAAITSMADDISWNQGVTDGHSPCYPVDELLKATTSRFRGDFTPYASAWESITVTTLDGLALRPTRVLGLFGANEDFFAGPTTDGDDILANTPLVSEPHYSMGARQGLLYALLATTDTFIVTCDGADVSNNKPTPLAVALRELLEVAAATKIAGSFTGGIPVATRHPRQNHHADTVTSGAIVADEPFTFDPVAPRAHELASRKKTSSAQAHTLDVSESDNGTEVISIADIARAVRNPLEHHVRQTLGVDLPEDSSDDGPGPRRHISGDGIISLTLDNLSYSAEGRRLLEQVTNGDDPDSVLNEWPNVRARTGVLPPGKIGAQVAGDVAEEVRRMIAASPVAPRGGRDFECRVNTGEKSHLFVVRDLRANPDCIVRIRFKRFNPSLLLEPWVELAALTSATDGSWTGAAHHIARSSDPNKKDPDVRTLTLKGDDDAARTASAHRILELAINLHRAASLDRIPVFERATYAAHHPKGNVRSAFADDIKFSAETRFLLGGRSLTEVQEETTTALDREMFGSPMGTSRFEFYSDLLWSTFMSTCTVEPTLGGQKGTNDGGE